MLNIPEQALHEGAQRACDLFRLGRLRPQEDAERSFQALWRAFGVSPEQQEELVGYLMDIVPVTGAPEVEGPIAWGLVAGVLVGLLIADSATPLDALGDLPVIAS